MQTLKDLPLINFDCTQKLNQTEIKEENVNFLDDIEKAGQMFINRREKNDFKMELLIEGKQTIKGIWEQPEIVSELVKLPRVLPFFAKSRQTLEQVMDFVEQNPSDLTVQSLLNAHSTYSPKSFPFRGFCLINGEQKMRQIEQVDDLVQRPVWFLFSGMGVEQWRCGMAREMMKLDSFRRSIMRSCELLKPYGINLIQLITGEQQDRQFIMTGIESYVYMTAIQIALVDCLRLIGIRADGMIGQSVGELVCAYIDQCLTHEQALMCSYYFANCLQQAQNLPQSLMAVVGDLTWDQLRSRCPSGVVPVCFDSVDQVVITGPVQLVKDLLRQLRLEGIYVREIEIASATTINAGLNPTGVFVQNFGLVHTQYLVDMLPMLRKCLETLNIVPRTRSSKWISTCCQPEQYSLGLYQTMSIDYLCKLFTTPVMLQQSLVQVPKSAILIEISPRSLMQTLLKKVLYNPIDLLTNANVPFVLPLTPLLNVNVDPQLFVHHFLSQLGRLYLHAVDFDSVKLFVPSIYEQSIYPVRIDQSCVDFFSNLGINFEPSTYVLSISRNPQSSLEIKNEPTKETRTTLEFFPFTEIQNQYNKSGYIMVDKDHNENDFIFNSIQPTAESKCLLSDFFDFYFSECNRYMKHLVGKINNPGQNVTIEPKSLPTSLQDQLEKITIYHHTTSGQIQIKLTDLFKGGSFLKFLINTSACLPTEPVDLIKKFNQAFSQDLVLDQLSNSTLYFKNCLNLIVENLSDKDLMLKIVEISPSGSQLCANKFVDILSSYGDLKHEIDYHFVPLNSSAQYLENESANFTIQDWNLKITNGKFECQIPDEFFGQFDLVLLNGCLSSSMALASEPEVKNWLQGSIEKLLKPSGFVMFNEFTSNFDFVQNSHKLEMLINGNKIQNTKLIQQIKQLESFRNQSSQDIQTKIEQQIKQLEKLLMQDECLNLKLQDMELWRRFLQGLTLVPIGLKTDSALRTIFIHRKSPTALNESIVSIDEFLVNQTESVSFIDKISQSLGDDKIDRLWLLNEKPIRPLSLQTALISVFEGLRSLPNGDKLRCLFLHDDQKIALDSKEVQNFTQLMERIRKADLVMNYIQSGQWGSVRIGEVLVEFRPEESEEIKCQQMFKQNETYVIVNGIDSEFGLNLIQWMVESGAKYLTVTTKKSNVSEFMDVELFKKLNDLQDIYGAEIRLSSVLDLNEENECLGLVKQTCKVSPEGKIGGIFHLGSLCDQSDVQSMFNLDRLTRSGSIMPDTGYFVLFTTGPNEVVEKLCNLRYSESSKQALCIDFNVLLNDLGQEESEVRNKRCIDCLEDLLSDSCKKEAKEVKVEEAMTKKQVTLMPKMLIEELNGVELSDATKSPIFVVHPIEGHVNMLRSWAEKFPVPVYGLQYTEECLKFQTIEQLGEFYWQQIEKFVPHVEKVHLVGHTFGDSVAFEMASQRPQQTVSLSLLDSGYTKTFLNSAIVGVESNFEIETLVKFYQQFVASNARLNFDQFYEELTKISDFDERVRFVVGKIVEQSQFMFDLKDIQTALRSFVVKSSMALKYVPTQALILNKILVVRPFLINGVQQSFRNILNLYHYFGGEVSLKTVDSTDKTFLIGENAEIVANLVKEYIGLENF